MKSLNSLTFGSAFMFVGLILMGSAGAAESGSIIQEALNALLGDTSPFHYVAILGFSFTFLGCLLLAYWILFGGSASKSDQAT